MALTIGLGRNSPIPLEGDPKKYEGLIARHGQWVRWMSARRCACVLENNRPNPRCTICRGVGWRYSFQAEEDDIAIEAQIVDRNTIELPVETTQERVTIIQDGSGRVYPLSACYGRFLRISGEFLDSRGMVYVSIVKNRTISAVVAGRYLGHGLVQVNQLQYQGPWANVPVDIVSVISVLRSSGTSFIVENFAVDKIQINTALEEPDVGEILTLSIQYMPPYKIAILNQAPTEIEQRAIQELGGDSLAVFPFSYKVSEQDILTSWASTMIRKKVLKKTFGDTDVLPDQFVSKIIAIEDTVRVYTENTHFVIWDRNTIRWIVDKPERPSDGGFYSVEYVAHATYRAITGLPNIRASENKRFPQRIALKLESGVTGGDQV